MKNASMMKKALLLCFPLIISACGGNTPTPSSGTTPPSTGGSTGGGVTLPYPYNPAARSFEDSDQRVPYYGEWVWAVSFTDGSSFVGRMSISKRVSPLNAFRNTSAGAGVWCPANDHCPYIGDIGLMGTVVTQSGASLFGGLYDNSSYQQVKFVGVDTDGIVGSEVEGRPTLSGLGAWQYYSGGQTTVGFAMAQLSTTPPVKALGIQPSLALAAQTGQLSSTFNHQVNALSTTDLQQDAVTALTKAFQGSSRK